MKERRRWAVNAPLSPLRYGRTWFLLAPCPCPFFPHTRHYALSLALTDSAACNRVPLTPPPTHALSPRLLRVKPLRPTPLPLPHPTPQRYLRAAKVSNSPAADNAALVTYLRRPFEQIQGTMTQQQQREAARAIEYIL